VCYALFEITVQLPAHFKREKLLVKLFGQACLPEVKIIEPQKEEPVLNFGHTFVNDSNGRKLTFGNVGVIATQVIIEIYEDPSSVFTIGAYENRDPPTDYEAEGQFTSSYDIIGINSISKNISKLKRIYMRRNRLLYV